MSLLVRYFCLKSNEMESLKIVNGQLKSENESIKMSSLIIQVFSFNSKSILFL